MLEIRNVTKVYRSKTGEQVKALDNVSVAFPESGMVFILGKSGSGKSTLLNVIGGLDSFDEGEFIIKGKSSKNFAGSDFDAYRNTFIGFIFQEYNILDDFTVGANIGLALELQGKKATDEKINEILSQVDLVNYAHRKPNELSGGQKQRIAIARALVKEPQIIMADEPTGALDSNTGKQIFDSLKLLSREKLVLIVSHDRDFAERYADRIIEIADGHIISDVTKHEVQSTQLSEGITVLNSNLLQIRGGYSLTPTDVEMINDYLRNNAGGLLLSGDPRVNGEVRSAAGVTEEGNSSVFEGTDYARDCPIRPYNGAETRFIRSRLPMKNALKMGASGLKHKKFRLVLTIFLSLIAFAMFGLADTMGSYDKVTAATRSIVDSGICNASVSLGVRHTYQMDGKEPSWYYDMAAMNDADIKNLRERTGMNFVPVFTGGEDTYNVGSSVSGQMMEYKGDSAAYNARLYGFVNMSAADISAAGMQVIAGRLPNAAGEIALPEFLVDQFAEYGFRNVMHDETVAAKDLKNDRSKIVGKHLTASERFFNTAGTNADFEIVGVVDTHFDKARYAAFLPQEQEKESIPEDTATTITQLLLQLELQDTLMYGFHTYAFAVQADIDMMAAHMEVREMPLGNGFYGMSVDIENGESFTYYFYRAADSSVLPKLDVVWLDGNARTTLGEREYLISDDVIDCSKGSYPSVSLDLDVIRTAGRAAFGEAVFDAVMPDAGAISISDLAQQAALYRYALDHYTENATMLSGYGCASAEEWAVRLSAYDSCGVLLDINAIGNTGLLALEPYFESVFGEIPSELTDVQKAELFRSVCGGLNICTDPSFPSQTYSYYDVETMLKNIWAFYDVYAFRAHENDAVLQRYFAYHGTGPSDEWATMTETQREDAIFNFLNNCWVDQTNPAGRTAMQLQTAVFDTLKAMGGLTLTEYFNTLTLRGSTFDHMTGNNLDYPLGDGWKLVGYFKTGNYYSDNSDLVVSDTLEEIRLKHCEEENINDYKEDVADHEAGIWAFAIASMPKDTAAIAALVEMNYESGEGVDLQFSLRNQVMNTLANFNDFIETGAIVFLWIGVGFAFFSALLLMNFISISISYKKREIGILRAVGARSSDVFKIFFSESLIIALINYVLAVAATLTTIFFINRWMRGEGINVTLLNFGIRQIVLMLLISVAVALIASFLPVWRIARKKPVDAIKDR